MDGRVLDWVNPARVAVDTTARVQATDTVTIVTDAGISDFPGCKHLVDAVRTACHFAGAETALIEFPPRTRPNEELPRNVAAAMAGSDVVFLLPTFGAIHTLATHAAAAAGARVIILGAATYFGHGDVLARLVPRSREEVEEWSRLTDRLASLFRKGGTLKVRSPRGTDLSCRIGSLQVHTMDAMYRGPGKFTHFIPGMAGGGIDPGSAEGVQVVDAAIMPIFRPLTNEDPVTLHIKHGRIVEVEGGPAASEWKQRADALKDSNAFLVVEYGFGCHPRARLPAGRTSNDERLYGGFHLGIGSNKAFGGEIQAMWHVDSSGTAATAWLDDELFLEDGRYVI